MASTAYAHLRLTALFPSPPEGRLGYHLAGEPVGSISTQGAYFTPAPPRDDEPTSSSGSRAILLLTDVFGLPLKNSKLIADELAARLQCDVWVPDMFNGRPVIPISYVHESNVINADKPSWWDFILIVLTRLPYFYLNRASVVSGRLAKFIDTIQAERKYAALGAIGHCFGGSMAIRLGATDYLKSIVICHPGPTSLDDIKAMKVPNSWVCAEGDQYFPESKRQEAEAVLTERKSKDSDAASAEFEFVVYKDMVHGFACRPNLRVPAVKEAYEGALDQAVNWFQKTLPVESST